MWVINVVLVISLVLAVGGLLVWIFRNKIMTTFGKKVEQEHHRLPTEIEMTESESESAKEKE
jgi:hypothetical protein